jgi:hypothetical protein
MDAASTTRLVPLADESATSSARVMTILIAFAAIPLIGYIDGHSSAYIAFSIFYVVPLGVIAWTADRGVWAFAAVLVAAASGLFADLWTIHTNSVYAFVNLGCRLALFSFVSWTIVRLRQAISRERAVSDLRQQVMLRVATDVREPLGEIYARIVDLGFDGARSGGPSQPAPDLGD